MQDRIVFSGEIIPILDIKRIVPVLNLKPEKVVLKVNKE